MILHLWSHETSAGLTLRGWHSEPSGKPVLLFTHGNGFCSRSYEPMLRPLTNHFDLWLVDVQGHGESDQGGPCLGWQPNAMLVLEAITSARRTFGATKFFALGHSFGGVATSYMMAAQPDLFARTVLLDPILFSPTMVALSAAASWLGRSLNGDMVARALKRRQSWPNREAAHYDLYGRGIFKGWHDDALLAHIQHALKDDEAGVSLRCHPTQEAGIFSSYPHGLWRTLDQIRSPTLILHGATSYPFVTQSARRLSRRNASVSESQVPGGHCFMQEHAEDTARRVAEFLLSP